MEKYRYGVCVGEYVGVCGCVWVSMWACVGVCVGVFARIRVRKRESIGQKGVSKK